jgi:phosphohistidine phosphatase SixA
VRLFIVRHAKAAPAAGGPDELRPLTTEGRDAARGLGLRLAAEHPDAVISSPLLRARETAAAIAAAAGLEVEVDERLAPGATAADLLGATTGKGETVVSVGHQPDCSDVVLELTGEEVDFPVGAAHEVEV